MLLLSQKAVSGYKYIICDKQAKPGNRWKVQYKRKRSVGFATPKEAAQYLLKLYPSLIADSVNTLDKTSANQDGRWWMKENVRLCASETTRMSLFGIRLVMYDKEQSIWPKSISERVRHLQSVGVTVPDNSKCRHVASLLRQHLQKQANSTEYSLKSLWNMLFSSFVYKERHGTVVGYFPVTKRHVVLFDEDDKFCTNQSAGDVVSPKTHSVNLLDLQNWKRIPWTGNVLDESEECGERVQDVSLINAFGPNCPRCFNNLGVGALAWSYCRTCKLNEPGVMWSVRFNEIRNNHFACAPKCYTEG